VRTSTARASRTLARLNQTEADSGRVVVALYRECWLMLAGSARAGRCDRGLQTQAHRCQEHRHHPRARAGDSEPSGTGRADRRSGARCRHHGRQVPETLAHLHYWSVRMTRQASKQAGDHTTTSMRSHCGRTPIRALTRTLEDGNGSIARTNAALGIESALI
jgi:hypothetical protein